MFSEISNDLTFTKIQHTANYVIFISNISFVGDISCLMVKQEQICLREIMFY